MQQSVPEQKLWIRQP